jgi:hypothetical protein
VTSFSLKVSTTASGDVTHARSSMCAWVVIVEPPMPALMTVTGRLQLRESVRWSTAGTL